jgi:hypothetical protein
MLYKRAARSLLHHAPEEISHATKLDDGRRRNYYRRGHHLPVDASAKRMSLLTLCTRTASECLELSFLFRVRDALTSYVGRSQE